MLSESDIFLLAQVIIKMYLIFIDQICVDIIIYSVQKSEELLYQIRLDGNESTDYSKQREDVPKNASYFWCNY